MTTDDQDSSPTLPATPQAKSTPPPGIVARQAAPGLYVDTAWPLTPHVVAAVKAAGYLGVWRYVPLPANASSGDISPAELQAICGAGLALGLVQHVRRPPWYPAAHDPEVDAQEAVRVARAVGYPPGAHIWLDLEGIGGDGVTTYYFAMGWSREILAAGYLAGLYCGYALPLTPAQLYSLPLVDTYWSDAGNRQVATRGCAVKQRQAPVTIAGVEFDIDAVKADALGGLPMLAGVADVA